MHATLKLVIVCLLAACGVAAQDASTYFRSGVDLIGLNVVATDPQGHFVKGLSSAEFTIFEDGVQQDISFFAVVPAPIDLALLLDTSASMSDKITTVQQAAIGFTAVVRPSDRISIVEIKDAVKVLHPLNDDVAAARQAIGGTIPRGNTSLYNAIYVTLKELMKERRPDGEMRRQAIVVLSDGDDTASLVAFDDLLELAKHAGVAIYTITIRTSYASRYVFMGNAKSHAESGYAMRALAQETGARAFFPTTIMELSGVYDMIADELASQYSVGYVSKNTQRDGAYRRINVRVERPGIRARTRSGYIAGPPTSIVSR
ncbi:MAG: VWA domain-containing protein [Vicinamibacterales bacterium]